MKIEEKAREILVQNREETGGYTYTVPSKETYPYQWLWDSCFHIIILAKFDPDTAKAELRALLSKQFEDGMIPHMIYWRPGKLHSYRWGKEGTSAITQPPMIAYALWEIYENTGDKEFLSEVYNSVLAFYKRSQGQAPDRHNKSG